MMARLTGRRRMLAHEPVAATPPLQPHESMRLRNAALLARHRYPGPVGEVLAKEITAWVEFGYRFGSSSLIEALVAHLLSPPKEAPP